nr:unnamed protein product [Callosobruchus analis]
MSTGKTPRQLLFGYYGFKDRPISYKKTRYPDQPVPSAKTIRSIFHNYINRGCINSGCNHRACQNGDGEKPVPGAKVAKDVNVCGYAEAALVAKEPVSSAKVSEKPADLSDIYVFADLVTITNADLFETWVYLASKRMKQLQVKLCFY